MNTTEPAKAEIHFFHCGDGDTILVRGGEEWGLVDANFVKYLEVRDRVKRVLKGVKRLRFVCITHFDLDHIRGLAAFLKEDFCEKDRHGNLSLRVDQVIQPLSPISLRIILRLRRAGERLAARAQGEGGNEIRFSREMGELMELLCAAAEGSIGRRGQATGLPEFPNLSAGNFLNGPKTGEQSPVLGLGPWRIVALGPTRNTADLFTREAENAFGAAMPLRGIFAKIQSNDVSRVLALTHAPTRMTVLLTGDSTPVEIAAALREWNVLNETCGVAARPFDRVKVSHHGAVTCHFPPLYQYHCRSGASRAIICASDDGRHHPHLAVITELKDQRIDYRVTGAKRSSPSRGPKPGMPMGAPRTAGLEDIVLHFPGDAGWIGGRLSVLH
jgi:beta-lactamase superfamily II metal-dependent hydrolase